jgi:tetratricopeptide (TPR) repeat protein
MKKIIVLQATIFILFCGIASSFGQTVSEEAKRHFDRGMAAVEMAKSPEDFKDAIKEFEQAIRLAPDWPDVYYNLGMVQEKAEKYSDAITNLKQYLGLAPNANDAEAVKSLINKLEYTAEQKEIVALEFKLYVMDNNCFSCEVPQKWQLERKVDQERMGVFKIELISPGAGKVPVVIYVSYFSKTNKYFKDYKDYVDGNSKDDMAAETDRHSPVKGKVLNQRQAFEFDREEKQYLHPDSKSDESVILKEKFYVLPAKEGFFVMHFSAPKAIFAKHLPVFEHLARTFKGRP